MNTKIEKSAIIGKNVKLGKNNYIGHNTIIKGDVAIGDDNYIGSNVIIGELPQHSFNKYEFQLEYNNMKNPKILIGSNNVIREFSTVHQPMNELTAIKDNCYIMSYNHVPHDAMIENNVILANNIQIGGHVHIHDNVNIGLSSTIHQFSTIGAFSMIGMGSLITKDILPFTVVIGSPAAYAEKINEIGMLKYGIEEREIEIVKSIYFKRNLSEKKLVNEHRIFSAFSKFYSEQKRTCISINSDIDTKLSKLVKSLL